MLSKAQKNLPPAHQPLLPPAREQAEGENRYPKFFPKERKCVTMKTQKILFRTLSLLMALVMFLSLAAGAVVAKAEGETFEQTIKDTEKGSIKVTKYATTVDVTGIAGAPGTATGTVQDETAIAGMKDSNGKLIYTPLEGAEFTLYQVADAKYVMEYYRGKTGQATEPVVADFYKDSPSVQVKFRSVNDDGEINNGSWETANGTTKKTNASGELTFEDLAVGFYVLVETTPPDQIAENGKAETTLISLPMVNTLGTTNATTNNSGWLYNIKVYPKNVARKGTVTLTKSDGSEKIGNVSFTLYKQDLAEDSSFDDTPSAWTKVDEKSTNNDSNNTAFGTVTFTDLTAGTFGTQYMLIEESAPNGYVADRTPLYFLINRDKIIKWNDDGKNQNDFVQETEVIDATKTDLTISLSNERPSLEKKVLKNGVEAANAADTDWLNDSEYRLDDTITYRLKVHIPRDIADLEKFIITDDPDEGIADHVDSVVMDGLTKCTGETHADYCVEKSNDGFKLTLHTESTAVANLKGTDVYVTYTAEMNGSAKIDDMEGGNGNKATLEYSTCTTRPETDPGTDDEIPTYKINDYAKVYTFHFDLTKYLDKEGGTKPDGVKFNLYDENSEKISFVGEPGKYRLAVKADASDDTTDILETKGGTITINGLEYGNYNLKEIETVTGYNLLSAQFPITVNCEETTTWTDEGEAVAWGPSQKDTKVFSEVNIVVNVNSANIINKKGFVLPQTGSMGYLLFCAAGLILIGGGAALIFSDRKKVIR